MHTMASEAIAQRPKRRYYSLELKGQVVAQCQVRGASVAGVALAHGINANIVHRWLREQIAQDGQVDRLVIYDKDLRTIHSLPHQ